MQLEDYLRIARAHWLAILVCTLIGGAVAFGWSSAQDEVYEANSSGFVTAGGGTSLGVNNLNDELSKSRAASYVVLATDRATADLVIDDLGLDTSAGALASRVSATQVPDTVIIQLSARAGTPEDAQELANAWAKALADRVQVLEGEQGGMGGMRVIVSEPAELPSAPVSPNVERNVVIGLALGLLLGMAYAVARHVIDRRVRSSEDVEALGSSTVAAIPDLGKGPHDLVVSARGKGTTALAAEAFRQLRTNLSYMAVDNPPNAIVVTSPKQSEGKTTVSSNLAAAIAVSGRTTTLVDADLRRPRVASALGLDGEVGLSDVLAGKVSLDEALVPHPEIEGLRILASGAQPPNPSELLGSQAMRSLIETLGERGMVILDAPPLLPVTDAAVLATAADGALVTVTAGRTLDHELATTLGRLEQVNAKVLGVILNRVSRKNAGSSTYYGTEYYG